MNQDLHKLWQEPKNWRSGFIYHCAEDPRLIVSQRAAWAGYSFNHAHRAALPALFGFLAAMGAPFLFLLWMDPPWSIIWMVATFILAIVVLSAISHREFNKPR